MNELSTPEWVIENSRQVAEHLWCPNVGHGWMAWLYMHDGRVCCAYHTASTVPNPADETEYYITPVWTEVDDEGSPFDSEYSEVDYIADHIYGGGRI